MGGGSNASKKRIFETLLILSVLIASCFVTFLCSENEGAPAGDYTGSGTVEDPYSGTLIFGGDGFDQKPWDLYITVGSTIEWEYEGLIAGGGNKWMLYETLGLDWDEEYHVPIGTIQYAGTFMVVSETWWLQQTTYKFYAVEPEPQLEFLSDPLSDGILVPPDHHLVTIMVATLVGDDDALLLSNMTRSCLRWAS